MEREKISRRLMQIEDMDNFYQYRNSSAEYKRVDDTVADKMLCEDLKRALQQLDEDERQLINESFYKEKSERKVAETLKLPRSTFVYKRSKILIKLKNFLENW